jgi:hypothetical protein
MTISEVIQRTEKTADYLSGLDRYRADRRSSLDRESLLTAIFAGFVDAALFRPISVEEWAKLERKIITQFPAREDTTTTAAPSVTDIQPTGTLPLIDVTYSPELNPGLEAHGWLVNLFFSNDPMRLPYSEVLLHYGADPNARTGACSRLLHSCAEKNDIDFAKLLIKHGAVVDIPTSLEDYYTPLMIAIQHHSIGMIDLLISNGADIGTRNSKCKTALDLAQEYGVDSKYLAKR